MHHLFRVVLCTFIAMLTLSLVGCASAGRPPEGTVTNQMTSPDSGPVAASELEGEAGGLKVTLQSTNPGVLMASPLEGEVHYYYTDPGFEVSIENVANNQRALASYRFEVGTDQGWEPLNLKDVEDKEETLFSGEVRQYSLNFNDARNLKYFVHPDDTEPSLRDIRLRVLWDGQQEPLLDAKIAPHFLQETWQIPTRVLDGLPTEEEVIELGMAREHFKWAWGEYYLDHNGRLGKNGDAPYYSSNHFAGEIAGSLIERARLEAATYPMPHSWIGIDEESSQVVSWLGESLIDRENLGENQLPTYRKIYMVRVEPDPSIKPTLELTNKVANRQFTGENISYTYQEKKFLVFFATVEVNFEGQQEEEITRVRVKTMMDGNSLNIIETRRLH